MPATQAKQTSLHIGVDVGGTFTDLVAWDGQGLRVVKVPSTPPDFDRAVIDATNRALAPGPDAVLVHGSTVATNALLQRAGTAVALITTDGFRDLLLIGRQNRPKLYALHVERPPPIVRRDCCFAVRERIDARGQVVHPLDLPGLESVIAEIVALNIRHVAVCLLFSFVNAAHEHQIAQRCESAGLTVSLSSELVPEFREFERASTTAVNASLRPVVDNYLRSLQAALPSQVTDLHIMQSGGGTLAASDAARQACKLVLSGPAGGVLGAAFVAQRAGYRDVITYDMGGTSTDVALVLDGRPQWTTASTIGGVPIGLPMFDIHTVGAGGGSIARIDAGGALRVGPNSAAALPGPACYGQGGQAATVTDANLVLGRILPGHFLGGRMMLDLDRAQNAIAQIASSINKPVLETALGIVTVAESNMTHAVRAVSSQRGFDPRRFSLVSFGGAGGLHACALAEALDMPRVLVPPYCGVLSALGMIVAPRVADASRTVMHLGDALDDARLAAEFGAISEITMRDIPHEQTETVEAYADVRFKGQSHELKVRIDRPARSAVEHAFCHEYARIYGQVPQGRQIEIVTLRVRRIGYAAPVQLPDEHEAGSAAPELTTLVLGDGTSIAAMALRRGALPRSTSQGGPLLVVDDEATTYVPPNWSVTRAEFGTLLLERRR
jgi:N-methylhydantoinase A